MKTSTASCVSNPVQLKIGLRADGYKFAIKIISREAYKLWRNKNLKKHWDSIIVEDPTFPSKPRQVVRAINKMTNENHRNHAQNMANKNCVQPQKERVESAKGKSRIANNQ